MKHSTMFLGKTTRKTTIKSFWVSESVLRKRRVTSLNLTECSTMNAIEEKSRAGALRSLEVYTKLWTSKEPALLR